MRKQWYKTKEIGYFKQFLNQKTKSHTEYLLSKFYLEIDEDGTTTIYHINASRIVVRLLTFKDDKIIHKDFDAILRLTPVKQQIFSEIIKKHLTAVINI